VKLQGTLVTEVYRMGKSRNLKLSENVEFLNIYKNYMDAYSRQPGGKNLLGISVPSVEGVTEVELKICCQLG